MTPMVVECERCTDGHAVTVENFPSCCGRETETVQANQYGLNASTGDSGVLSDRIQLNPLTAVSDTEFSIVHGFILFSRNHLRDLYS